MRTGITVHLSLTDRKRLQAIVDDRNSPQKHVWRARIVLATADALGTAAIMRTAGVSKTAVWRWQECFIAQGVDDLLPDKTRPTRVPRLADEVALFAAFDVLEGKVIGRCLQRHRRQEFVRFLNAVERKVPAGKTVLAILAACRPPETLGTVASRQGRVALPRAAGVQSGGYQASDSIH
jgi:hypothetical protein